MTDVQRLLWIYSFWALSASLGELDDWASLRAEGVSLALDLAVAEAHRSCCERRVQEVIWADRLHQTLLSEVAW